MAECGARPGSRVVACRTLLRESRLHVIGIPCAAVIGKMTGGAVFGEPSIDAVFVARGTLHTGMRSRQGKSGCAVIE